MLEYILMVEMLNPPVAAAIAPDMQPKISKKKYLNEDRLAIEHMLIMPDIDNCQKNFIARVSALPKGSFSFDLWIALEKEKAALYEAKNSLMQKVIDDNPKDASRAAVIAYLVKIAGGLLQMKSIDKQDAVLRISGPNNEMRSTTIYPDLLHAFKPLRGLDEFNLYGDLNVTVANKTAVDIIKDDANLADCYRAVVEAATAKNDLSYDGILTDYFKKYPELKPYENMARFEIHNACNEFLSLGSAGNDLLPMINNIPTKGKFIEKSILDIVKEMITKSISKRTKLLETLFSTNTESKEFISLKTAIDSFIRPGNSTLRSFALQALGLDNREQIAKAYRTFQALAAKNGAQDSFYSDLTNSIREFVKDAPREKFGILTSDDLSEIMAENKNHANHTLPTFQELQKTNEQIFNKSSGTAYELDPQTIDFGDLSVPKKMIVNFSRENHFVCTIGLSYQARNGEEIILALGTNAKKGEIDWNFLENYDDPKLEKMRNIIMSLTKSALSTILRRLKEGDANQGSNNGSKKNHQEPYVPRKKEDKPKQQGAFVTPINEPIPTESLLSAEKGPKICIDLPEDIEDKCPKDIPQWQWDRLIKKIRRFNFDNRTGNLKLMVEAGEKERLFRLKVVKELRVLVTEVHGNGHDGKLHYAYQQAIKRSHDYKEI